MLSNDRTRLRALAAVEGISYILLVGIAVPIKYLMKDPSLVKWIGQIHGIFFVVFLVLSVNYARTHQWKFTTLIWFLFVSSFIPFGTFYMDRKLLK